MRFKINKPFSFSSIIALAVLLAFTNCEREISDEAILATYPSTADVFRDNFVGMGSDFIRFYGDSNFDALSIDRSEGYQSNVSIRIDVPQPDNQNGGYAGGIFVVDGVGRDLTKFDALTFWVKASRGVTVDQLGFGEDFGENKYMTTLQGLSVGTAWQKVVIPIPDPSKLTQERGLFRYAIGSLGNGLNAFTFWIDEIKFEKLGNNRLLYPYIFNGDDRTVNGFIGSSQIVNQLGALYNLANGQNVNVQVAPDYFTFNNSNPSVLGPFEKNQAGQVTTRVIAESGSAVVSAQLGNTEAQGTLTINAAGVFPHAPIPNRSPSSVISIFSDAYTNVPVRHYNGFFSGSNTQGGAGNNPNNVDIQTPFPNGNLDNIIHYTQLDFVSIGMYETVSRVNVSAMTHFHVDINVKQAINSGNFIRIELHSSEANGPTTSSGSFVINAATLLNINPQGWISLDIPLSNFPGFNDRNNLGQIFFVSGNPGGIFNIWVDNVYFYAQ